MLVRFLIEIAKLARYFVSKLPQNCLRIVALLSLFCRCSRPLRPEIRGGTAAISGLQSDTIEAAKRDHRDTECAKRDTRCDIRLFSIESE